jgi:hypothetical protein
MSRVSVVSTQASLSAILSTLAHVAAPGVLVHVGAGDGRGTTHLWHAWQVPRVILIDADGSRLAWAEKAFGAKSGESPTKGFVALEGLVSKSGAEAIFNVCSHPGESGLLEPKALTPLWANLSLLEAKLQQTVTLDDLLSHSVQAMEYLTAIDNGWLIVDCFPGANILTGASELLAKTQVVCVRVIADVVSDDRLDAAKADAVDPILQAAGFEQVAAIADLHPSIVYAVYSKPVASMLQEKLKIAQAEVAKAKEQNEAMRVEWEKKYQAQSELQNQAQEKAVAELAAVKVDLEGQLKTLKQSYAALENVQKQKNDELVQVAQKLEAAQLQAAKAKEQNEAMCVEWEQKYQAQSELQSQAQEKTVAELAAVKVGLEGQLKTLKQSYAALENVQKQKNDELVQVAQKLEAALAEAAKETSDAKAKAEQALSDSRKETDAAKKGQIDLQKQLSEKTQELKTIQASIDAKTTENNELNLRQQLMNEELVKAEGQIELIKDLLLREPGL